MVKKVTKINHKTIKIVNLIIIILLGVHFLIKRDYEINYKVNDYQITEKYYKKDNYYTFTISKEDNTYHFLWNNKDKPDKKIIKNIIEYQTEEEKCIKPESNNLNFIPECFDNEQISYHLTSEEMKKELNYEEKSPEKKEEYNNIKIYNTLDEDIYIWNYRGFDRISTKEQINIFSKDIYSPTLIAQVNNTLWIPNYEEDYYFKEAILLDMKTGKRETWQLPETIYFDSSILGVYDNKIYLIDKHEQKEWEIDIQKKKIKEISEKIYNRGWEKTTMNKLLYQSLSFYGTNPREYIIKNDYLYEENEEYETKLSNNKIDLISQKYADRVYYFIKNKLYSYDDINGERLLLESLEWNFNKDNIIFVVR